MCAYRCTLVNLEDNNKEILAPFSRNCCEPVIPDANAKLFRGSLGSGSDSMPKVDLDSTLSGYQFHYSSYQSSPDNPPPII